MEDRNELTKVNAEVKANNKVNIQDVRHLCEMGIPAINIALSLLDIDDFLETVNKYYDENIKGRVI